MSAALEPIDLASESDFALGGLRLRPSLRTIEGGARSEILEPRVMQVLVALAQADGGVVSRDTLIARCWGGRVVGDDAINRCIGKIRQVAGLAGQPAFLLETVPRVGYRLRAKPEKPTSEYAAELVGASSTGELAPAPPVPEDRALAPLPPVRSPPRRGGSRRFWIVVGVGLAACLVAAATGLLLPRLLWPAGRDWAVASSEQFIASSLRESQPSISHDGSMIAYAAGKDFLHRQIYMKRTAGGASLPLTHDEFEDVWPTWSPDDTEIAFAQVREDGNCHLMIAAVPAGTPHEVGRCKAERASKVVWSADAGTLYFEDYLGKGQHKQVWQLDISSGATKALTEPSYDMFWYAVSPDGRWLAYGASQDNSQSGQLIVRDLTDQSERTLKPTIDFGSFTFSSDSQALLLSRTSNSDYGLWSIALQDGRETRFFTSPVALESIAAGPNGLLTAQVGTPEVDLVRSTGSGPAQTIFGERIANAAPDVASDGTVAWLHVQGSYGGIFVQALGGTPHELVKLSSKQIDLGIPVWSPSAQKLAILTSENDAQEILVVSAAGATLKRFPFPDATLSRPAWRSDDDTMLVAVQKEGHSALWEIVVSSGAQTKISDRGDWIDLKSRGDDIFGTRAHDPGVWAVSDSPRQVSLRPGDANPFAWAIRGDTIAYVDLLPDGPKVMAWPMKGGLPLRLLDVPDIWPASWYIFTVDARTGDLIYARDNGDTDIELFRLVQK